MYIKINGITVKIKTCKKFRDRFLGLMFKKNIKDSICLPNTGSIHTFFMRSNIDLIFLRDNKIIDICYNVKPWKIIIKRANSVIELPQNTLHNNDKIEIFN